jgi:nucleolar pre-ribosomal-associated protein 1
LQPALVNRHLQSVIQHPSFDKLAYPSSPARNSLLHLVHTLFYLHPTNTCQPSHIAPLPAVYGGSQSPADRHLFHIFRLYEETRKMSIAPFLARWSLADGSAATTPMQAVLNLDPNQVFRTCLAYPVRPKETVLLDDVQGAHAAPQLLYDPLFAMSLCGQALVDGPPSSALDWVAFFRTNVVCLAIRGLSCEDGIVRQLAGAQLSALSSLLDVCFIHSRWHV